MKLHTPKLAALTAACVLAFGIAQPAHALFGVGDIVLDPTNLVQNTLTAVRTLEQINNQIRQLQNEAQMLINQARNLASLPFSVVSRLRSNLALTQRLIEQAKGLAYDVANLDKEFKRLYPEKYAATGHEPAAGLAGQAVDPDTTVADHAGPGGLAGTGAAGGGCGTRA